MKKRATRLFALLMLCMCPLGMATRSLAQTEVTPRPVVFRTQTMGTWASLTMVIADSAGVADLAYRTLRVLHHIDSLMSNWTDTSEVARINREAATNEITVHPEVAEVLDIAEQVARESNGAFDITVEPLVRLWGFIDGPRRVPRQEEIDATLERTGADKLRFDADAGTVHFIRDGVGIDFGGIAKGYGVDRASDVLRGANATNVLLDLSGNMVAIGNSAKGEGWTVGIRDPSGTHSYLARIRLYNEAVATSGDYEQFVDADGKRYGHILDPRTGWSAHGLKSVTVVAKRATVADAWATALFVLGAETARQVAHEREELAVVMLEPRKNGKDIIWVDEQLRSRFDLHEKLSDTLTVRFF